MRNAYRWMYPAGDRALNPNAELPYAGAIVTVVNRDANGNCIVRYCSREYIASSIHLEFAY